MTYNAAVNWMFKQLPMYQRQGKTAFKKDLSNTIKLATHLGNPQRYYSTIHVGGTNGKGSTSHMLASALQEAGYKVGLYTSPHLKDFRERIKINGQPVSKQYVVSFIKRNKTFLEANNLSFFEMTVGMAFDYFFKKKVDVAVIEVGLGGRLDSTNIITPKLSVITNIGFDHKAFLGDTRAKIATEKAGIIKPNIPVVIGESHYETQPVFKDKAKTTASKIYFADALIQTALPSDLKGNYQQHNIKTAMQSVAILNTVGFSISDQALKNGLISVVKNTGLQGRWQVLQHCPKIICDTAHNVEGLTYVIQQLRQESFNNLHLVFGVVNDKDLDEIMPLLPKHCTYYLCKPNVPRGLEVNKLKLVFDSCELNYEAFSSVNQALRAAKSNAKSTDLIFIGGSTFVVAEVL